ncbi:unknown protein [Germiston virus]|nr:unknown protein [Germiston virus]
MASHGRAGQKSTCPSSQVLKCSLELSDSTHLPLGSTKCRGKKWTQNFWRRLCARGTLALMLRHGQQLSLEKWKQL